MYFILGIICGLILGIGIILSIFIFEISRVRNIRSMVRKLEQKYKPTGIALMPDLRSEQIDKMYKMDEV
jgi:hypothetical protein